MSHLSQPALPDFDFWNVVGCAKCHLPFATESNTAPLVPFWLTECGHIICNSHLNADQSCAHCGTPSVQVIPLQREMEPPMSNWFRSLPDAIDSIAQTVKYQQDTMGSLLAFYKDKCRKQRSLIERMRSDASEAKSLRILVEELQGENEQLRQYVEYGVQTQPGEILNRNGKRRMMDGHGDSRTNSSPRSTTAPPGPDRLTLPPDHQEPHLVPSRSNDATGVQQRIIQRSERPGSSRFSQQYAYAPPPTSHFQQQTVLSHEQMAPVRRLDRSNLPKDVLNPSKSNGESSAAYSSATLGNVQIPTNRHNQNRRTMAPPPTPQPLPHAAPPPSSSSKQFALSRRFSASTAKNSDRTVVHSTPSNANQRFVTNLSISRPTQHVPNVSDATAGRGSQRVPFIVSGAQAGLR